MSSFQIFVKALAAAGSQWHTKERKRASLSHSPSVGAETRLGIDQMLQPTCQKPLWRHPNYSHSHCPTNSGRSGPQAHWPLVLTAYPRPGAGASSSWDSVQVASALSHSVDGSQSQSAYWTVSPGGLEGHVVRGWGHSLPDHQHV